MAAENLDEPGRKAIFDQYQLTCDIHERSFVMPLFIVGTNIRFSRSDGSYLPAQMNDLMESYPETRSLRAFHWDKFSILLGVDLAAIAATQLFVQPTVSLISLIATNDAVGALMGLPVDTSGPIRLANAYNRGLAADLGLSLPDEPVIPRPLPAGQGWLGGSLCLEGFLGMSVQSRSELDHFYGAKLWDNSRPWAPALMGGAVDYAVTDHWQAGVEYDPWLPKRAGVKYLSGNTDIWTLDAMGVLGRLKFFTPLSSSLGLVITGALGQYSLSGAKLATTYWYGTRPITGHAVGGYGSVGLERVLSKTSGINVAFGYRKAAIASVDEGSPWAQASRNGSMLVNHSGPFFTTAYRYYWGVARRPFVALPQEVREE